MLRTLPIRVAPIDGEALDSWLEAIAHRTHTAFGDLLSAVGLRYIRHRTSTWMVQPTPEEAAGIAAVTGVARPRLATMTLDYYAERAVRVNAATATISRTFPWGNARGSRFCPTCLAESGGRWQLSWRLGWTFACTDPQLPARRCLPILRLAAATARTYRRGHSPTCPLRVYGQRRNRAHPFPVRGGSHRHTCRFLRRRPLRPACPERNVNTVIATETLTFGVYATKPQPRINVLADIRAVAGRSLVYATPQDLTAVIPADLLAAHRDPGHRYGRGPATAGVDVNPVWLPVLPFERRAGTTPVTLPTAQRPRGGEWPGRAEVRRLYTRAAMDSEIIVSHACGSSW